MGLGQRPCCRKGCGEGMLRLKNLSVSPTDDTSKALRAAAAKQLGAKPGEIGEITILRRSIDARKKQDVRLIYTVDVKVKHEGRYLGRPNVSKSEPEAWYVPNPGPWKAVQRPVIVGFGPAGMFAALVLARAGARPIVLERGQSVEARTEAVRQFRALGILDPESNVQFGEGGAGTFSDGKLHSGVSGPRSRWVLRELAAFGAGEKILTDAMPHVGTDVLVNVVRALREEVLRLGGEIRFGEALTGITVTDGRVTAARTAKGEIPCAGLILAIGHSARDTFQMLEASGVPMEPKAFSMGVRIEHLQKDIDRAQFGPFGGFRSLGPAPYKLSCHLPDGGSAYTFCMCPGGYVMAAASEIGGIVTNGMSYSGRNGTNANAALLASVEPGQFPYAGPLGGMYWQREIEQAAFRAAGERYLAPAQLVGDFQARRPSSGPGKVQPTYLPGVTWTDLHTVLPEVITGTLHRALPVLGKYLHGFDAPEAVLTGPETRSSSPVRILRGEGYMSPMEGLYPCGEGAGYAGGIISAAVDGLRCAEALLSKE